MAVTKTAQRFAAPPVVLPLAEDLRIYLYQLADQGLLSREEADELVAGGEPDAPLCTRLLPGQLQFVLDVQTQLHH